MKLTCKYRELSAVLHKAVVVFFKTGVKTSFSYSYVSHAFFLKNSIGKNYIYVYMFLNMDYHNDPLC